MTRKQFLSLIGLSTGAISTGIAFTTDITPKLQWECPFCKNPELLEPKGEAHNMDDVYRLMGEKIRLEVDHEILHELMNECKKRKWVM
jgi:hypothetical protein